MFVFSFLHSCVQHLLNLCYVIVCRISLLVGHSCRLSCQLLLYHILLPLVEYSVKQRIRKRKIDTLQILNNIYCAHLEQLHGGIVHLCLIRCRCSALLDRNLKVHVPCRHSIILDNASIVFVDYQSSVVIELLDV